MSAFLTSDSLIASVKNRALIPTSQNTFTNEDFLRFANEEMQIGLVPSVLQVHEEYLLYIEDIPLVSNVVKYDIPYRAIGNKTRDISYLDAQKNLYNVTRIQVEDVPFYQGFTFGISQRAIYILNNQICLIPNTIGAVSESQALRVTYYMRPNELVKQSRIGVIQSINTTTGVVTLTSTAPTVFSTSALYDIIQYKAPHRTLDFDVQATAVSGNTITFAPADLPSELRPGDHIALAGECMIPQIPDELHVVLAQRVACRCLEALGDREGLAAANAKLAEMEQKTGYLIDNRVEGAPQKIINHFSPLRQNLFRRKLVRY